MKKSSVAILTAASAAAAASAPYFYRQNKDLRASHYVFSSEKVTDALDGFRIVQVSDLHSKVYGKKNCLLLALIEAQLPDLIVLTGDLMNSYHVDLTPCLDFAERAAKLAPCYFVTGNHEHSMETRKLSLFLEELERVGVTVLRNRAIEFVGFRLIGVDCQQGKTNVLQRLMKNRPQNELNILLSHKPHYAEHYEKSGVDLVLSGHAHGGQFRLPVVGGLYAPGQGILPKYTAGMYRLGKTVMVVSRGLGNSSFPLRIDNKPELVTVKLKKQTTA